MSPPRPRGFWSERWRELRISVRDTVIVVAQFQGQLLAFSTVIVGCGTAYWLLAGDVGLIQSWYVVLDLAFLQPMIPWPSAWYLQIFFFLMPVLVTAILAHGLADFAVLMFNRRMRGKEWAMAVASTLRGHVVLVGFGHLGFRVAESLHLQGTAVAVIDQHPDDDLIDTARAMDMPVITGDASREGLLEGAGIRHARCIVLCVQNDSLNLQIALKARHLNPAIKVVVRIFDDGFAVHLRQQFGFLAMSATSIAAPGFVAAVDGAETASAHAVIAATVAAADAGSVASFEARHQVRILSVAGDSQPPSADTQLAAGHKLVIAGTTAAVRQVASTR